MSGWNRGLGVLLLGLLGAGEMLPGWAESVQMGQARQDQSVVQSQGNAAQKLIDDADALVQQASKESLEQALVKLAEAIRVSQAAGDKTRMALALLWSGGISEDLSNEQQAIAFYERSLPLYRELGDRSGEANTLKKIGSVYSYSGLREPQKALEYLAQSLSLWREVGDRSGEANTLDDIGWVYFSLGENQKALKYYTQSLHLWRAVSDRSGEARILATIGGAYSFLGENQKALEYYTQSLHLWRALSDRSGEARTLATIGGVYSFLGEKQKALEYYAQSLYLSREVGDRFGETGTLNQIGHVYSSLGEKQKALEYYTQSLPLTRAMPHPFREAVTLTSIGLVYSDLGEKQKALEYLAQSLILCRKVGERSLEATILTGIGEVYDDLGELQKALEYYAQSLSLWRAVGDRSGEARTLTSIGSVYYFLGEQQKALEYYAQSLPLSRGMGDRSAEGNTLSNIATTLVTDQPAAAIPFYKQAVNLYESLRKDIRQLPQETQKTYTESISYTYRRLADTLLAQGRIGEAQQVLELLKIQETKTYTRATSRSEEVTLNQSEQTILKTYETLIAFGQDLLTCKRDPACQTSPKATALTNQRDQQNRAFEQLAKTLQAQLKDRSEKDIAFIDPNNPNNNLRRRAQELLSAQPGSLLIYPLVLDDKMWLLVASDGPVLTRYEVKVTQKELADTVIAFRTEMKRCETRPCTAADHARAKTHAQKLYNWMFPKALQEAIATAPKPITNLIFAPDRATRYLPMGALYDGKQYLAQRYSISTIVAASKTEATARLPQAPKVLGMGLSQSVPGFSSLPSVPLELNAIVTTGNPDPGIFPGNIFLNNAFTRPSLKTRLTGHDILHLATHGKFEPGDIDKSFLMLGDGSKFPIADIDTLDDLVNVHLVVLSACETALGDRRDQDGIEIAGISNAFLQRGAKAVIASLWQVNDPATGAYMQRFYDYLAKPGTSKVAAMQQVSRDFMDGKVQIKDLDSFRSGVKVVGGDSRSSGEIDLSHPYYWSAFILIGNGL
jgi:CHAT domain-containing protein